MIENHNTVSKSENSQGYVYIMIVVGSRFKNYIVPMLPILTLLQNNVTETDKQIFICGFLELEEFGTSSHSQVDKFSRNTCSLPLQFRGIKSMSTLISLSVICFPSEASTPTRQLEERKLNLPNSVFLT